MAHGKHKSDKIDLEPDWFYKGDGSMIVPPEMPVRLPEYALEGTPDPLKQL